RAQFVYERKFVPLLFREELFLGGTEFGCLEPVARGAAAWRYARNTADVAPVLRRLFVRIVEDRVRRRLCRRPFGWGLLECGWAFPTNGNYTGASSGRTAMTSLPRGSMTFTATRLYLPAANGIDVVPLNAPKASVLAVDPSALAIFSQEFWFGKNAWV